MTAGGLEESRMMQATSIKGAPGSKPEDGVNNAGLKACAAMATPVVLDCGSKGGSDALATTCKDSKEEVMVHRV